MDVDNGCRYSLIFISWTVVCFFYNSAYFFYVTFTIELFLQFFVPHLLKEIFQ